MKLIDIIKENDGELIVHDWKVTQMGMDHKGLFSILTYSSGYDALSMMPIKIKVLYADHHTDPQVEVLEGESQYYENWDVIIEDGYQASNAFFGYSANGVTRNAIQSITFNVIDDVVDYENPKIV